MINTLLKGRLLKNDILNSIENLPPMPQIVHKARQIMDKPDSSFEDFSGIIEKDPALAMKILKMSNSAYYSKRQKVTSIQEATLVLGLKTLSEVITIAGASRILGESLEGYEFTAGSLWLHSLAVGFGSKIISEMKFPELKNEAFTAGLIHDVGKLILDDYVKERKQMFLVFLSDKQLTSLNAEKELLGFDHAEIASMVCKKWKFPKSISEAIRYHHNPSRIRGNKLAYIIHLADQIAEWIGLDVDGITVDIQDDSFKSLSVEHDEIEEIMNQVEDSVQKTVEAV